MTLVLGILVGSVAGWRRASLPTPRRPVFISLALAGAAVQLGVAATPSIRDQLAWPGLIVTNVCVGAFLVLNTCHRSSLRPAFVLAALGWALNALVVLVNRGDAGVAVGASPGRLSR